MIQPMVSPWRRAFRRGLGLAAIATTAMCASSLGDQPAQNTSSRQLHGEVDLASPRSVEPRFYVMGISRTERNTDGSLRARAGTRLFLAYEPPNGQGQAGSYVCRRFEITRGKGRPLEIRQLNDYRYSFQSGIDEKNQVFGIDLARFQGLTDEDGRALSVEENYWVYNTFIDFHSFMNTMCEPGLHKSGIQQLRRIGDRIVHSASHSSPPVHLNDRIQQGSTFTNGEITLRLEGLGLVHGNTCALVLIDSGDGSWKMHITPVPGTTVDVTGYSRYGGICAVNLQNRWPERFRGDEMVVSETLITGPNAPRTISAFTLVEREIEAASRKEFASLLAGGT